MEKSINHKSAAGKVWKLSVRRNMCGSIVASAMLGTIETYGSTEMFVFAFGDPVERITLNVKRLTDKAIANGIASIEAQLKAKDLI